MPADHVSRNPNDTYYIDSETVLRCHTSAHQAETLRKGERAFLVTGTPLALTRCLWSCLVTPSAARLAQHGLAV